MPSNFFGVRLCQLSCPLFWGWIPGLGFFTTHTPSAQLLILTHTSASVSEIFLSGQLNCFSEPEDLTIDQQPSGVPGNGGVMPPTTAFKATVEPFADIYLWLLAMAKTEIW